MAPDRAALILDAQHKGFRVLPNDDDTGWLVAVPARPRHPANTQGEFTSPERAWMIACSIAKGF